MDRDNVLANIKQLEQERGELIAAKKITTFYEETAKRVSLERRALQDELEALERRYAELRDTSETLQQGRDALKRQIEERTSKGGERAGEKRLQEALAKAQQGRQEEQRRHREEGRRQTEELAARRRAEREAQRQTKELEARLATQQREMSTLQGRFASLEERYAGVLSEHRALQHQAKQIPANVTTIAREHERLLKDLADTHYNMGVLFSEKHDHGRAVKEFHKVIELKPDDAEAHYNLGVIYAEHLPDRQKALTYFRRYLQLKPQAGDANWVKQYIASWQAWEAKERLD